jgi:prepilin-type N-terminal cleavage/methylation domain-containing protein
MRSNSTHTTVGDRLTASCCRPPATDNRQPATRKGFTLIELMVVVSIIGILVGLLLPAVNAARRRARRVQIASLVKECDLACGNYRLEYNQYPWKRPPEVMEIMITLGGAGDAYLAEINTWEVYAELKGQAVLGAEINTIQDYLGKLPNKFVKDKGNGLTIVDTWEREIRFRVNPDGMEPVIWSLGNPAEEHSGGDDDTNDGEVPADTWEKTPGGDDIDPEIVKAYYYYGEAGTDNDIGTL